MHTSRYFLGALAAGALALSVAAPGVAVGSDIASWQMNEDPDATTMTDSSGNNLHGVIEPQGSPTPLETGVVFDDDDPLTIDDPIGYHWVRRPPAVPPVQTERVVQVPEPAPEPSRNANSLLDFTDPSETYTVEVRYKTREKFGNIVQKGQARARGGQFKIQNPVGRPSCLFNGSAGRGATRAKVALNDNQWHVLTCIKTPTAVEMWVDGEFENRKNGATGTITNDVPVTIGGKINCDQGETTCDYFSGDIDYVRISKG